MFDGRCFARLDSRTKHAWRADVYHACSAVCIHLIPPLEYFTNRKLNEEEALINVAEIGEIETEETPSRKGKQSNYKASKSTVTKSYLQVQQALRKSSRVIRIISR